MKSNKFIIKAYNTESTNPEGVLFIPHEHQAQLCLDVYTRVTFFNGNTIMDEWQSLTRRSKER